MGGEKVGATYEGIIRIIGRLRMQYDRDGSAAVILEVWIDVDIFTVTMNCGVVSDLCAYNYV